MKRALLLLTLFALASLSALAADVSGVWNCTNVNQTLDIKQDASKLTGTLKNNLGTLRIAAQLNHWICENAKSTRAYLKRVDALAPVSTPVQGQQIK